MKYSAKQNLTIFLLVIVFVLGLSTTVTPQKQPRQLYPKNGADWPGICSIGKFQSPINIIDGKNTVDDSNIIFDLSQCSFF